MLTRSSPYTSEFRYLLDGRVSRVQIRCGQVRCILGHVDCPDAGAAAQVEDAG